MTIMSENHNPNSFIFASNKYRKSNDLLFFFNFSSSDIQHKNDKAKQQSGHFLQFLGFDSARERWPNLHILALLL